MPRQHLLQQIVDEAIAQYAMLRHPFYQLWSEGKLSDITLAEYSGNTMLGLRLSDLRLRMLIIDLAVLFLLKSSSAKTIPRNQGASAIRNIYLFDKNL